MLHISLSGPRSGQLVVLCHGVTDSAASLADLIARLNTKYLVAAVDHLGHGLSPRLAEAERHDPLTAALQALHDTISCLTATYGPAIGIGHSMGGALLTRLAEISPDSFRGVIAEDPAWLDTAASQRYAQWGPETLDHHDQLAADPLAALTANTTDYPTWPERERLPWLQAKFDVDPAFIQGNTVGYCDPWVTWLVSLRVPTLVISSDGPDVILGPEGCARTGALGNDALTTCLIPGTSHCVRRDDPTSFDHAITPYLEEWSHA